MDNLEIASNKKAMANMEEWLRIPPNNAAQNCPFADISKRGVCLCRFCNVLFGTAMKKVKPFYHSYPCPCNSLGYSFVHLKVTKFLEWYKNYNQRL
jgi:hypothetical protein